MKSISFHLAGSLIVLAGLLGFMVGYATTPEYRLSMYGQDRMDLGQADRFVDLRYVNAMIAHHRGAMLLAQQAQVSTRQEITALAQEILSSEPKLIDELYTWKKEWYKDGRAVRDLDVPALGTYDDTFDLRFLNALIAHHERGIVMTQEIRLKSSRAAVLNNADAVESFLTKTGETLRLWRASWYNL